MSCPVPPRKDEYFRPYLTPLEAAATELVRKFLKTTFVDSGVVKGGDAESLLDVRVRFTPEDGNECHWGYGKSAEGSVCEGVCGRYDPSGGLIEVFLGCIGGSWYESFDYTVLHLLVHHLQARARGLTLTSLTPRVPTEAEGADSPQEIEAAYLAKLFLSLSRLSMVTIREAMSYSRIWRPLMSVRFGARYALLGKGEKIDREALELLENPFGLVRTLSFKLRKLRSIAEVTRRGAGFRAYVRNVLGIEVGVDFESIDINYEQLCFTSDAGRLSVCYEGDHPRIPGTGISVVFAQPLAVNLVELRELAVLYDPPRARVLMRLGEESIGVDASLELVENGIMDRPRYHRKEDVAVALSRVRSPVKLPEAACSDGFLELVVPRPVSREPHADVPTLDLSAVRLAVSEDICPPVYPRVRSRDY